MYDKGSFEEKKAPFVVITLCGLSAPLLAALTTYADLVIGLSVAAVLIVAFTVATYFIFPRTFFWVFLAIVLFQMSWISIGSALGYYYTASEECVPGGEFVYFNVVTRFIKRHLIFIACDEKAPTSTTHTTLP